ncbi:hypothetical protein ARMSODRAFT_961799 [Armillaria solidipes]|uniref:Uncharacterized protein n=1 Tax=Armillaria solidipes TaxID=1076256 RepID=A0A2H3BNJ3_9AGAR|nr:hypothetical protein ARMSODRAFT_961799 [Armillaria solidipes]
MTRLVSCQSFDKNSKPSPSDSHSVTINLSTPTFAPSPLFLASSDIVPMDPNARLIRRSISVITLSISSRYHHTPRLLLLLRYCSSLFALSTLRFFVDELPLEELSGAEK